jgi:hypothetical protein
MKTSVLALDLATTTGWAWHSVEMPRPFFGAFRLPGDPGEVGKPADALESWLFTMYERSVNAGAPITHWFFEQQHIGANVDVRNVYRLIALGGIVEKVAWQLKPPGQSKVWCYGVPIQSWRKHFLGRGSGFKRDHTKKGKPYLPGEDPKEIAIQKCGEFGWFTDVADAAEACGILDYALAEIGDKIHPRPWRDALLMRSMER